MQKQSPLIFRQFRHRCCVGCFLATCLYSEVSLTKCDNFFGRIGVLHLELLPNGNDEQEETTVELSPEETLLRDLVNLAVTIQDDEQVNPLTVVDMSQGTMQLYRIETGERRYWAIWQLREFHS